MNVRADTAAGLAVGLNGVTVAGTHMIPTIGNVNKLNALPTAFELQSTFDSKQNIAPTG